MKSPAKNIKMTSYDDLFNPVAEQDSGEKIVHLPLSELHTPKIHPFKVRDDEAMQEMAESIKRYGVMTPGVARPLPEGGYELVAGNRRKRASEIAGVDTLPVIVRELDDDAAIILMVDSNLQRETLLPSEKAFAYKMKLDAMKRQGERTDLTSATMLQKFGGKTSRDILAEQSGESHEQVRKFIRLTELITPLLDMVDEKQIALRPAVELSYLPKDQQELLLQVMERDEVFPSIKQANELRYYSKEGRLDEDTMTVILNQEKPLEHKVVLDGEWVQRRFPKHMTPQQIKERINKALDLLERHERRKQQEQMR